MLNGHSITKELLKEIKNSNNMSKVFEKEYEEITQDVVNDSKEELSSTVGVIDPKTFILNVQAENSLNLYVSKLEEYYSKIGEEKQDIISQKAKVLEAVLGTDMLKID